LVPYKCRAPTCSRVNSRSRSSIWAIRSGIAATERTAPQVKGSAQAMAFEWCYQYLLTETVGPTTVPAILCDTSSQGFRKLDSEDCSAVEHHCSDRQGAVVTRT
jgi:hypothetical protein